MVRQSPRALRVVDDASGLRREGESALDPQARAKLPTSFSVRASLLEQCPLSCRYCLPGSVTPPTAKARWLSPTAWARLLALLHERGARKVRFTGGEPLARPDVVNIVAAVRALTPALELALTTNGQRLVDFVDALRGAGLARVTVHLDTLREDRFVALMGDGSARRALDGMQRARAGGLDVKWNVVVQRGENDDELGAMLTTAAELGVEIRFIEQMNTGSAAEYVARTFLSGADIVARIAAERGAVRVPRRHPSDPAALFRTDEGQTFGLIASDTEPFCADCDRLRVTADGRLRGCLYQAGGVPVGAALLAGADDDTLRALIAAGIEDKRSFHPTQMPARVPFSMADVGG